MSSEKAQIPPGARNVWGFNFANSVAFQITLGAPTVLYAKSLGASATVLGVITALTPLLAVFQIPAAHFLARVGYRRFILAGWGMRNVFVVCVALLPLLTFLTDASKLALLLAALFFFNLSRGIASGAWLPWISDIIPPEQRGRFLSVDQTFGQTGSLCSLLLAALTLRGDTVAPWQYSMLFFFSVAAGMASLEFIRRTPESGTTPPDARTNEPVPWREIVAYAPFRRLVAFNVLYYIAIGSVSVFTVSFLRSSPELGWTAGGILFASALAFLGAVGSLWVVGRVIDRTGSRPILRAALGLFAFVLAGWAMIAAGFVPPAVCNFLVPVLFLGFGIANGNFNIANLRITMATMPPMGRNHFFAYFTVITSLSLGFAPILWGVLIDWLTHRPTPLHALGFDWNAYVVYFLALLVSIFATLLSVGRLTEAKSVPLDIFFREISLALGLKRLAKMIHR